MENDENLRSRILKDFEDFLKVDRQLAERTVKRNVLEIKKLFKSSNFNPLEAKKEDIREYLKGFIGKSPWSYANLLKSPKDILQGFLGKRRGYRGI